MGAHKEVNAKAVNAVANATSRDREELAREFMEDQEDFWGNYREHLVKALSEEDLRIIRPASIGADSL